MVGRVPLDRGFGSGCNLQNRQIFKFSTGMLRGNQINWNLHSTTQFFALRLKSEEVKRIERQLKNKNRKKKSKVNPESVESNQNK